MRKKIAFAVTATLLATTLTACGGSGNDAPTRKIAQVTDGIDADLTTNGNHMALRNIQVQVNEAGDATLIGTIVNEVNTKDALLAVAINRQTIKISGIATPQNSPINFGGDSANATVVQPASGLVAGQRTSVSFFFGLAGTISVDALVVTA